MATDAKTLTQIRATLSDASAVREVKMFGGLAFMLNGNMLAASSNRGLLLRVGERGMAEALARGAQPMVMKGRTMKGYVRVTEELDARKVKSWLRLARTFVETLPPKKPEAPRSKNPGRQSMTRRKKA